jgi:hypothetical protein
LKLLEFVAKNLPRSSCEMTAVESPFKASFKVLGGAAAAIATMFSPARIFAPFEQPEPEPTAPNELADKTTAAEELGEDVRRRVQMTKAFTALRADITTEKSSPQKSAAPSMKRSPTKAAKKTRPSPKKTVAVQRKAITKVKSEPMRRSARSRSYKKGQFSEAALAKLAWSGQGTRASPYVC